MKLRYSIHLDVDLTLTTLLAAPADEDALDYWRDMLYHELIDYLRSNVVPGLIEASNPIIDDQEALLERAWSVNCPNPGPQGV
jgi:hypothetical protein